MRENKDACNEPSEGYELWDERRRHFPPSMGTKSKLVRKCNQYCCISQILQRLNFLYWYLKITKAKEKVRFSFSHLSKEEETWAIDLCVCSSFCGRWKLCNPFKKLTNYFDHFELEHLIISIEENILYLKIIFKTKKFLHEENDVVNYK